MRTFLFLAGILSFSVPFTIRPRLGGLGAPSPESGLAVPPASQGPQNPDLLAWDLASSANGQAIQAVLKSSLLSVAPYFSAVRLEREFEASSVVCGAFSPPSLTDDGANRFWIYSMARPSTGGCAAGGGGNYVAVGTRGTTEHRTRGAP